MIEIRQIPTSKLLEELVNRGVDPYWAFVQLGKLQFHKKEEEKKLSQKEEGIIDDTYY